ncbi:MAG: ribonuclease III [Pseudobutyrivibrio ruminis]|uniref:Mini-ribonuclease 3 n=1 Tax=Pseudobutyrivibrio ruminis TaxID=46206 RepID=A0A927UFC2_9FIRM|nr:ribonuclease III domain-containing protein [Pseudobutyrivibrio sp.]MBE5921068.1 ribonuclease III [Pseudobutyrivibrio ruminis]MBQ6463925.1 ribonuclease III [Pseudobutyrivibrio sp.]
MASSLNDYLNDKFNIEPKDIRTYSPLTLAYIGDAIFDVVIRSILVNKGNTPVNKLHQRASQIVKATTQAAMIIALMDELTDEERDWYRRGRNSKPHTKAKNASTMDYLEATGFEAVMGYLYLTGDMDRICELVNRGIELTGLDILD